MGTPSRIPQGLPFKTLGVPLVDGPLGSCCRAVAAKESAHVSRVECHLDLALTAAAEENDDRKVFALEQLSKGTDEVCLSVCAPMHSSKPSMMSRREPRSHPTFGDDGWEQ